MKHLKKFFESNDLIVKELRDNREQIAKDLLKYSQSYRDMNTSQIEEFIWSSSFGDEYGATGEITYDMMLGLIEEIEDGWVREQDKFLDLWHECSELLTDLDEETTNKLKEILLEYSDIGKVEIVKSAGSGEQEWEVLIQTSSEILLTLDFHEVISRIKEFTGIKSYSFRGNKNHIKFQFSK
jgi:hypothetical protein